MWYVRRIVYMEGIKYMKLIEIGLVVIERYEGLKTAS